MAPSLEGVTVKPEALGIRDAHLAKLEGIVVSTVAERDLAIELAKKAKSFTAQVEKDRVAIKEPFLEIGKRIDTCAKEIVTSLKNSITEVERKIGAFNEKLRQEQIAKERARLAEIERVEKERKAAEEEARKAAEAVEAATSAKDRKAALIAQLEAEEKVEETASKTVVVAAPTEKTPSAVGGSNRYEISVEVVDIKALYEARPDCVKLTPDLLQIKHLASLGMPLPGVLVSKNPIFSLRK